MSDESNRADCYSAGERGWMEWTQRLRAQLFHPLLWALARCGVKPDHVTWAGLGLGAAFAILWQSPEEVALRWYALGALGLHVLLDGIDGPLARYLKLDSPRGSLTDSMADQLVVLVTSLALMSAGTVHIVAGGVYIFCYTLVMTFAMIRNALRIPYGLLVRPRFVVYAWIVVEHAWLPGTIDYLIWTFDVILAVQMMAGFFRIRECVAQAGPTGEER